jgi:peptide/nickel transport system permease protein/glutathione transport system permease protein
VLEYALRRLIQVPLPLVLVLVVVFFAIRLSGDPVALMLADYATEQQKEQLRHSLGLDQPLPVQFGIYLSSVVHGDFGESVVYNQPAGAVVAQALPSTIELTLLAMLVATVLGIVTGLISGINEGGLIDRLLLTIGVAGQALPSFWLGLMLIVLFAVNLHWLPTSGTGTWQHLVLPTITLAAFLYPQVALLTRAALIDTMHEQYVTTARAKGLPHRTVVLRHALRNSLNPVVTSIGLNFGLLLGGAVITETVFAWPGVGQLGVKAIFSRDLPIVSASVFVLAVSIVLCNLAADLVNGMLDPRIRE